MQTRFIRITEVDESDWGYDDETVAKLLTAYHLHAPVTVLSVEVDNGGGVSDSYNVCLADGTVFEAVCGVHLEGIENYVPVARTLTCQYLVELKVENHIAGAPLGHSMMAVVMKNAISKMLEGAGFAGYTTTVGEVTYETDYYEGD